MFVARDDFSNIENFGIREQQIKPCIWKMKFAILTNKKKKQDENYQHSKYSFGCGFQT